MRGALCWKQRDTRDKRGYEGGARAGSCLRRNDGGGRVVDRGTHDLCDGSFNGGCSLPSAPRLTSP